MAYMDEEQEYTPAVRINYADLLHISLTPIKFAFMGSVNAIEQLQGLLSAHSAAVDVKRDQRDFERLVYGDIDRL